MWGFRKERRYGWGRKVWLTRKSESQKYWSVDGWLSVQGVAPRQNYTKRGSRAIRWGSTVLLVGVVLGAAAWFYGRRHNLRTASVPEAVSWEENSIAAMAPTVEYQPAPQTAPQEAAVALEAAVSIPETYNLAVPFTSQAPHATWDARDEDACEEAGLLMAHRYYQGRSIASPEDADSAINEIMAWENEHLGKWQSTTAQEVARIAREMLGYETASLLQNPTVKVIKQNIANGHPVLVPAAGRQLGNPFFKSPGPLYHMLVIKGYNKTEFITNDPGTRRGADYRYKYDTVLNANHDWNGGDVESGDKVMIVLK